MKNLLISIFCLAALLPQTVNAMNPRKDDPKWVEKNIEQLKKQYSGFDVHPYAPTNEFIYMMECFMIDIDNGSKFHVNADNLTYTLDRSKTTVLKIASEFRIKKNAAKVKPEDRVEYGYEFSAKIRNAYDLISSGDYTENIRTAIEKSKYSDAILPELCTAEIHRGGEYFVEAINNLETGYSHPLTVLSEPTVNLSVKGTAENNNIIMHYNIPITTLIASGYPYSDRLADYQSGEMMLTIIDANNENVYQDTMKLEASADKLKLEYMINKEIFFVAASPKYTFKLSGPLLKEDIVIEKEVVANHEALEGAIMEAKELSDSIKTTPGLKEFKANAEALKKAAEEAKAGLKLTVYEQDKIDQLALDLFKLIDDTRDAINERSGITGIVTDEKKTAVKSIENGQIVIKRNNRTYTIKGIELRK